MRENTTHLLAYLNLKKKEQTRSYSKRFAYVATLASVAHTGMGAHAIFRLLSQTKLKPSDDLVRKLHEKQYTGLYCKALQQATMFAIQMNALLHNNSIKKRIFVCLSPQLLEMFPLTESPQINNYTFLNTDLWLNPGTRYTTLFGFEPHLKLHFNHSSPLSCCLAAGYDTFDAITVWDAESDTFHKFNMQYVPVTMVEEKNTTINIQATFFLLHEILTLMYTEKDNPVVLYKTTLTDNSFDVAMVDTTVQITEKNSTVKKLIADRLPTLIQMFNQLETVALPKKGMLQNIGERLQNFVASTFGKKKTTTSVSTATPPDLEKISLLFQFAPFSLDIGQFARTFKSEFAIETLLLPRATEYNLFWMFYISSARSIDESWKRAKIFTEMETHVKQYLGQGLELNPKPTAIRSTQLFKQDFMGNFKTTTKKFGYKQFKSDSASIKGVVSGIIVQQYENQQYEMPIIVRITQCASEWNENMIYNQPYDCHREPVQWYIQDFCHHYYPHLVPKVLLLHTHASKEIKNKNYAITFAASEYWEDKSNIKLMSPELIWAILFFSAQLSWIGIEHFDLNGGNVIFVDAETVQTVRYVWHDQKGKEKELTLHTNYHTPKIIDFEYSFVRKVNDSKKFEKDRKDPVPFFLPNLTITPTSLNRNDAINSTDSAQYKLERIDAATLCRRDINHWASPTLCFAPGELHIVTSNAITFLIEMFHNVHKLKKREDDQYAQYCQKLKIIMHRLYKDFTNDNPSIPEILDKLLPFFNGTKDVSFLMQPKVADTKEKTEYLEPQVKRPYVPSLPKSFDTSTGDDKWLEPI